MLNNTNTTGNSIKVNWKLKMKLGVIFSRTNLVLWFEKSVRRQEVGMTNVNHSFAKLERLGCYRGGLLARWLHKIIVVPEPIWLSASLSFECCFLSQGYNMAVGATDFTFTVQGERGKTRRAPTLQLCLVGKKL